MLLVRSEDMKCIADQAETAYPGEACGLLLGFHRADGDIEVTRVVESENKASPRRNDRFEVDPKLRLNLMRKARGTGHAIVGHYHSHPNGLARPSATDLAMAYEPYLVWLIIAVVGGQAVQSTAHLLSPGGTHFDDIGLDCLPAGDTT